MNDAVNNSNRAIVESATSISLTDNIIFDQEGNNIAPSFRRCYVYFEIEGDLTWYKHIVKDES
jgi:hypothetical protein